MDNNNSFTDDIDAVVGGNISLGEEVYTQGWSSLVVDGSHPLPVIMENINTEGALDSFDFDYEELQHRADARTAATFVRWLGSVAGNEWVRGISSLARQVDSQQQRCGLFLAAWGDYNRRHAGRNRGFRQIELLLAEYPRDCDGFPPRGQCRVTMRECEVFDHVAIWLGTDMGLDFIGQCETQLLARRAEQGIPAAPRPIFKEQES